MVYYQRSCGSAMSGLAEQEERREHAPQDLWPFVACVYGCIGTGGLVAVPILFVRTSYQ